ncbi:MAG: zinc carboxypeptidase, partial [Bacteroidota bacterium]
MKYLILTAMLALVLPAAAQQRYFYPEATDLSASIPTPEQFLGYPIGSHHTRHDKVVEYFRELDRRSDRVTVRSIGYTFEHREQITAFITAAENHSKLEEIRQAHLKRNTEPGPANLPMVIQLGYNVHGNEP